MATTAAPTAMPALAPVGRPEDASGVKMGVVVVCGEEVPLAVCVTVAAAMDETSAVVGIALAMEEVVVAAAVKFLMMKPGLEIDSDVSLKVSPEGKKRNTQ